MRFKLARIAAGHTQESLAREIGVSQQTVSKWESGINKPSRMRTVLMLEKILNIKRGDLFDFDS